LVRQRTASSRSQFPRFYMSRDTLSQLMDQMAAASSAPCLRTMMCCPASSILLLAGARDPFKSVDNTTPILSVADVNGVRRGPDHRDLVGWALAVAAA
jgi:hypothetical protein